MQAAAAAEVESSAREFTFCPQKEPLEEHQLIESSSSAGTESNAAGVNEAPGDGERSEKKNPH